MAMYADATQIITERISESDRELYVKRAAVIGKITLLTSTFGRGTDFVCTNQELLTNGGIFVIQTFFSRELSEEFQIQGRCARQGDQGSYQMILMDKELEWVLGAVWRDTIPTFKTPEIAYQSLNHIRDQKYNASCASKELGINQLKTDHSLSFKFLSELAVSGKIDLKFLINQNKGPILEVEKCRTIVLMDATGSMGSLLSACKDTVAVMFERASKILETKGLSPEVLQLQFVVYRDYDCKDQLLQASGWESKPTNLKTFMGTIHPSGGGDYEEAIEVGFWYCYKQHTKFVNEGEPGIAQVILIADAPAKEPAAISRDRKRYGGEAFWATTPYATQTHWRTELNNFKSASVPVHTFYLDKGCQSQFSQFATETGGQCSELNINASDGADALTHLVTKEILRKAAGEQGEAAVQDYIKRFVRKSH